MNAGGKPSEKELKMMEDICKEGKEQQKGVLPDEAEGAVCEKVKDVAAAFISREVEEADVVPKKQGAEHDKKGEKEVVLAVAVDVSLEAEGSNYEIVGEKEGVVFEKEKEGRTLAIASPGTKKVKRRGAIFIHPSFKKVVCVARGFVYLQDASGEPSKVHGIPLRHDHRKVEITEVFQGQENLELPVPVGDELTTMKDAVNGFVQWPRSHIYTARYPPKSQGQASTPQQATPAQSITTPISHTFPKLKDVRSLSSKPTFTRNLYMQKVRTLTMRALYQEADHRVSSEQLIIIPLEEDILGKECVAIVSWEILAIWTGLLEIDIHHLYAWMKYLKARVMTENKIPNEQYGFLCPYILSMHIKLIQYEDRVDYIARELAKNKKLVFAPIMKLVIGC